MSASCEKAHEKCEKRALCAFLETEASIYKSGQIIIFHQPRFPWNKGISLTKPSFGVRSCEVAIIWPDKWLFQLDDSKSLDRKWLYHQTSIKIWLFMVPGWCLLRPASLSSRKHAQGSLVFLIWPVKEKTWLVWGMLPWWKLLAYLVYRAKLRMKLRHVESLMSR